MLSFLLPTAVMFFLFILNGIYPFGDRSFLSADLYHQYMPFFSELTNKIRNGESLFYSWNVGLGSNFLALFVYYLASPTNLLALLVPDAHLVEFIGYMIVVKVGLCGLCACIYFEKHFQTENLGVVFAACFYALSGFMAAYNYNIMWVDCVILFPLIVLGLERLVREGKWGMYCITLALAIYTNYYLSIMICFFLVLYFAVLLIQEHGRKVGRSIGLFALGSLLSGGMASVLLIPEVCAILQTDFGAVDFPDQVESYFPILDVLARHFVGVSVERGLDHWPNLYCGSIVLFLIPMYLMNERISVREKFCKMGLAAFLLLSFSTNVLNFIWHGLNYPDSLPARQSFLYIFLVLVMCFEAFLRTDEVEPKQIVYGYLFAVVGVLFCEKFIDAEDFGQGVKLATLLFVTVFAVLLYLFRTRREKKEFRKMVGWIALAVVVAECTVNTGLTSIATTSRTNYFSKQEDYEALSKLAEEEAESFYRIEKFTRKTKNDGTLTGYPTASVFSSTLNSSVTDFYEKLGMRHSKVFYGFDGATALTSALFNVQFMFGEDDCYENALYSLAASSGETYLYACEKTLPFGYVAPTGFDLTEASNPIRLQNELAESLTDKGKDKLFVEVSSFMSGDDCLMTAEESGIYYGLVTASGTKKITCIGGSPAEITFSDLKRDSILYLGYLEMGQSITLTNANEDDETPEIAVEFYRLNEVVLDEVLEALSAEHMENVTWDATNISGTLSLREAGRLVLSIPYEKGWTVLVNGKEVEPSLFGDCLMALDLEAGEYEIELHYVPTGFYAGIGVSVGSVIIFGGLWWWLPRRKRRKAAGAVQNVQESIK